LTTWRISFVAKYCVYECLALIVVLVCSPAGTAGDQLAAQQHAYAVLGAALLALLPLESAEGAGERQKCSFIYYSSHHFSHAACLQTVVLAGQCLRRHPSRQDSFCL
jgi:hypothetical protein